MKKTFPFLITLWMLCGYASAQNQLLYRAFTLGGDGDTSLTKVLVEGERVRIESGNAPVVNPVPGTATHYTFIDYATDTIVSQLVYSPKERYCSGSSMPSNEYSKEGTEKINGYRCTKYKIVLFSNTIELWVTQDLKLRATPIASFADLPGTLVHYRRNGNAVMQLAEVQRLRPFKEPLFPGNDLHHFGEVLTRAQLNNLEKEKLVITVPVFNEAQICFNPKITVPQTVDFDTTLSFANGTVVLKRLHWRQLPTHYRLFAEVTQYSNGDAYDRTGSIFLIPTSRQQSFLDALKANTADVLPHFTDKEGGTYQGIRITDRYLPLVELVRFFTPFGIRHYNQYRSLDDREWATETRYKQDISDLQPLFGDEVLIGAFIGNYDGGGHKLSLTLKAYPESDIWDTSEMDKHFVLPLFNTCNVMEMAGQNYGRFFGTDSLTVSFDVPEGTEQLTLRYITTGHGGWDTGDEFVPKANTILIDGQVRYVYTPWRCDCGTYRTLNPASGNFWNGMSSSDYSRSGWCPGTATQPTYFDLSDLKPGRHTITVAIPQGAPEGGSFSSWNVSGAMVGVRR